ncbi:MAG TPA: hypothetical protein ENI23_01270 [bacterium]|nr:hypothetical protein [bacterium]
MMNIGDDWSFEEIGLGHMIAKVPEQFVENVTIILDYIKPFGVRIDVEPLMKTINAPHPVSFTVSGLTLDDYDKPENIYLDVLEQLHPKLESKPEIIVINPGPILIE